MVESGTDPAVVTSRIMRETRDARDEKAREDAALALSPPAARPVPAAQPGALAAGTVPAAPPAPPPDPEAAFRHGRLAVVAALVLALLLLWIRERRAGRAERGSGRG